MQCDMACEHCDKMFKNNIFTSTHALDDITYFLATQLQLFFIFYFILPKHKNHSGINLLHVFLVPNFQILT
jgi:hypothetical protein